MDLDARIRTVRRFNRFYTRQIGLLHEGLAGTAFPLTEARVLYELAHRERPSATELGRDLGRILRGFERRGLVRRTRSTEDARRNHLALTPRGRKAFAPLNARSHDEAGAMLRGLGPGQQEKVVAAMQTTETVLGGGGETRAPYLLRPLHAGDMGEGHSSAAKFLERHDPRRERGGMSSLRAPRGLPEGDAVDEHVLTAARRIYAKAGFRLVRKERHRNFGHDLVGETWELTFPAS